MSDVSGLVFFAVLAILVLVGIRALAKPRSITEEEFEKSIEKRGSVLSAGVGALERILNPKAEIGKRAVAEAKLAKSRSGYFPGECERDTEKGE